MLSLSFIESTKRKHYYEQYSILCFQYNYQEQYDIRCFGGSRIIPEKKIVACLKIEFPFTAGDIYKEPISRLDKYIAYKSSLTEGF